MIKAFYKLTFFSLIILIGDLSSSEKSIQLHLRVGGIKQVVKIESVDRSKSLFLFITDGPGSDGIYDENKAYLDELKKQFTVVAWDQRNCGQTLKINSSLVKLTVHNILPSLW